MKVEVKEIEENSINFSKPQLLISDRGSVIMCLGEGKDSYLFSGVSIENAEWGVGYYTNKWVKEDFKPFKGKIILEND